MKKIMVIIACSLLVSCNSSKNPFSPLYGEVNVSAPLATVKLMFIHHSTGGAWLQTGYGGLGAALNSSNFYVNESDYGWDSGNLDSACLGLDPIGDHTDTSNWPCWFNPTTMSGVFQNNFHSAYDNAINNPGGENTVIMFKSCFPNSEVGDDISDEKAVYNSLLPYFASRPDKMFVLVIPPPMIEISNPARTRELANWLSDRTNGWLKGYTLKNVYAFDYYNVLTHPDNHHFVSGKYEYHIVANAQNTLYYPSAGPDDHPSQQGQQKATYEFLPLLKAWYNEWKDN